MNHIYLDYQRRNKPLPWAGVALILLALAVSAILNFYYRSLTEKTGYWESKSGQLAKTPEPQTSASTRDIRDMALEIKHANEVLNQISMPWDKLFQAVEWSSGRDVALLTIEPDAEQHIVKISGEAKNIDAALNYIGHLSEQEIFTSVYLQSHQVQQQNPEKPVRFALVAGWREMP